ncbi:hypothetical protein FOH10_07695 [Nocardia otitidiscaviarum]|uniref:Uncharacterized protein n=1 Tax=Nocardia otitidiscaviarum TaxID=1823 RepID=A0A516NIB6_9NOCA|nr:hypothetical protein [Nocardia otitidiscaviarum]MCP9618945.1 hypothetical protein [Nocardia otitidiscaviarum]QDP78642.1 hypothetical protein FOH10_07695 [Nocardia otitidiscaviarum]
MTISMESDWIPAGELLRLLNSAESERPGVSVTADTPEHRGLDPAMAVALVSGAVTLLTPIVTEFAKRVFAAEPDATVAVERPDDTVVLLAALPEDVRGRLIADALEAGARRIRIGLDAAED